MPKRVTQADIAQVTGVSPSTVSLVLRNRPGITDETRQRVLEAAQALGYQARRRPDAQAQPGLSRIGVVLRVHKDEILQSNPFYSPVLGGIEAACRQHGIRLLYTTALVDEDNHLLEAPTLLSDEPVDGVLVVGTYLSEAMARPIKARGLPVVLVDGYGAGPFDAVVSQNFWGAYSAISYLVRKGHRHIGLVGGHNGSFPSLRERWRGYVQALEDHQIQDVYIAECPLRAGGRKMVEAARRLLQQNPQMTALFGCNDLLAIRAMQAAHSLSRRIPDDLSVVGFDDIEAAHLVMPGLTTMRVDKPAMGRMAVQMLLQRVQHPELPPVVSALATRLVERQSVRDVHQSMAGKSERG